VSLLIFCSVIKKTHSIIELVDRMLIGMVGGKRKVVLNDRYQLKQQNNDLQVRIRHHTKLVKGLE
jgi:hypothetical protein